MSTCEPIELVLEHDGHDWLAYGAGIEARAGSLPELDRTLARRLAAMADCPAATVTVHMRFNRASLPVWMRQYMAHYFNRTVHLQPRPSAEATQ